MGDILLTLKLDTSLIKALDEATADAGETSRSKVAVALLRDWLTGVGYMRDEDLEEDTSTEARPEG